MIYIALILLILGLGLLIAELFIPGFGIFGISGIISILAAIFVTAFFIENGIYYVIGEIALSGIIIYELFKFFKSKNFKTNIILKENLKEDKNDFEDMAKYIGTEGKCKTPLRPFGSIELEDETVLEAFSDGEFIEKGDLVKIIRFFDNKLYVKKESKKQENK